MSKAKTRRLSNSSQAAIPTTKPHRNIRSASGYDARSLHRTLFGHLPGARHSGRRAGAGGEARQDRVRRSGRSILQTRARAGREISGNSKAPGPGAAALCVIPMARASQSDVHALIIVEMLNPPKQFAYKCEHLLGIHKCLGRVPESMTLDAEGQTYQTHAGEPTAIWPAGQSSGPRGSSRTRRTDGRDFARSFRLCRMA